MDEVIANNGPGEWRYEVCPRSDAKVQLLTIGAVATSGNWTGAYGEFYVAWCPLPKRNKAKERELGVLPPHRP
jgi:hypothetical protein